MRKVNPIIEKYGDMIENFKNKNSNISLVGLLQDIHKEEGCLSRDILTVLSDKLDIHISQLFSIVTFYSSFRLEPVGKYHICTCEGTACHVHGAQTIMTTLERELKIKTGETTEDGMFTLDTVKCLGACALAPIVTINDEYHSNADQLKIKKIIDRMKQEESERKD